MTQKFETVLEHKNSENQIRTIVLSHFTLFNGESYSISNELYRLMKDNNGSRECSNNRKKCDAVLLITEYLCEYIIDNYLIHLLFHYVSKSEHQMLLNYSILRLSKSKFGYKVGQKMLNFVQNMDYLIRNITLNYLNLAVMQIYRIRN